MGKRREKVKKIQNERFFNRKTALIFLSIITGLIAALLIVFNLQQTSLEPEDLPSLKNAVREYKKDRTKDTWFFTAEQVGKDLKSLDVKLFENIAHKTEARIEKAFDTNQNIPEVAKLKKFFSKQYSIGFYTSGNVLNLSSLAKPNSKVKIVLYGENQDKDPLIKYQSFSYDTAGSKRMMIASREMSSTWFNSAIIHEFEHALRLEEGITIDAYATLSSNWAEEELHAISIGRKVLDNETKDKYSETIRRIVERLATVPSLKTFYDSITLADFKMLDEIFGEATYRESGLRLSQFILSLSDDWLKTKYQGEELKKWRVINLQFLGRTVFFTP